MASSDLPLHRRLFELLKASAQELSTDMGPRFGAALSFYTLFSLVPLLFLIVAVVGFVSTDSQLTPDGSGSNSCEGVGVDTITAEPTNPLDRAIVQIEEVAGPQIADQFANLTCEATASRQQALWIGIALAAFSGSAVFLHLQGILNFIFGAPATATKGIVNTVVQRGIAVGWALLLAVLVFTPLVAVGAIRFLQELIPDELGFVRGLTGIGVPIVSLLVLIGVVAMTFQFLSRIQIPWKAAWRGGAFTAVATLVGAFGVGFYLGEFGAGGALGAIGGVAILLFFFNLLWIIYLFGAEVTKVYADYLVHGTIAAPSDREEAEIDALRRETAERASRSADESSFRTGAAAFLAGLLTGWVSRRRD